MGESGSTTPAGWYPSEGLLRYWDGHAWTKHTAPQNQETESPVGQGAKRAEEQASIQEAAVRAHAVKGARRGDDMRPDIAAALSKMSYKLGSKREIKRLPEHLWDNEKVAHITAGTYGPGAGIVVLTDRRLFFLKDGVMSKTSEDFPIEKISSVQWSTGMLLGKITVFASGNKAEITDVQKTDGKAITDAVRARLSGGPEAGASQPMPVEAASAATVADGPDAYERLKKLGELRDAGILTEEEFSAKKQSLLDQI